MWPGDANAHHLIELTLHSINFFKRSCEQLGRSLLRGSQSISLLKTFFSYNFLLLTDYYDFTLNLA